MRLHGNNINGDKTTNEQQHKEDKRHYVRTDKNAAGYGGHLVRHAQGTRATFKKNKAARLRGGAPPASGCVSDSDEYAADADAGGDSDGGLRGGDMTSAPAAG